MSKIRVTVWYEFRQEKYNSEVAALFPKGIHGCIGDFLSECDDIEIRLAALDDDEQGIPDEVLDNTDVLIWWGHGHHHVVRDDRVEYIRYRVCNGMGFIALHSAHQSKPFMRLVGTTGDLSWGDNYPEIVWNVNPTHPIAAGVPHMFRLESEELYAEPFNIPAPDDVIFTAWYPTGHVFRAGCTFRRGYGRIFYFQPGHETCRSFFDENVRQIIKNAVRWCAPVTTAFQRPEGCPFVEPIV